MIVRLIFAKNSNGLTKTDSELARLRGLLEKKYSNDYDAGYTYIDPVTSDSIPLTPFMMKEWARAMVTFFLLVDCLQLTHCCSMTGQYLFVIRQRL